MVIGTWLVKQYFDLSIIGDKLDEIMPKCCKCHIGQSGLNKGGLCNSWFKKKINTNVDQIKPVDSSIANNDHPSSYDDMNTKNIETNCTEASNDREII